MGYKKLFLGLFFLIVSSITLLSDSQSSIIPRLKDIKKNQFDAAGTIIDSKDYLFTILDIEDKDVSDGENLGDYIEEEINKKQIARPASYVYTIPQDVCLNYIPDMQELIEKKIKEECVGKTGNAYNKCKISVQCTRNVNWRIAVLDDGKGLLFYDTFHTHFFHLPIEVRALRSDRRFAQSKDYIFLAPFDDSQEGFYMFRKIDIATNLFRNNNIPYYFFPLPGIQGISSIAPEIEKKEDSKKTKPQQTVRREKELEARIIEKCKDMKDEKYETCHQFKGNEKEYEECKRLKDTQYEECKLLYTNKIDMFQQKEVAIRVFHTKTNKEGISEKDSERIPIQELEQYVSISILSNYIDKLAHEDLSPGDEEIEKYRIFTQELLKIQDEMAAEINSIFTNPPLGSIDWAKFNPHGELTQENVFDAFTTALDRFNDSKTKNAIEQKYDIKIASLLQDFYAKYQNDHRKIYIARYSPEELFDPSIVTPTARWEKLNYTWLKVGKNEGAVIDPDAGFVHAVGMLRKAWRFSRSNIRLDEALNANPDDAESAHSSAMWSIGLPLGILFASPLALKPLLKYLYVRKLVTVGYYKGNNVWDVMAGAGFIYQRITNGRQIMLLILDLLADALDNQYLFPGILKKEIKTIKESIEKQVADNLKNVTAKELLIQSQGLIDNLTKQLANCTGDEMRTILTDAITDLQGNYDTLRAEIIGEVEKLVRILLGEEGVATSLEYMREIEYHTGLSKLRVVSPISDAAKEIVQSINLKALQKKSFLTELGRWQKDGLNNSEIAAKIFDDYLIKYDNAYLTNSSARRSLRERLKALRGLATIQNIKKLPTRAWSGSLEFGVNRFKGVYTWLYKLFYKVQEDTKLRFISGKDMERSLPLMLIDVIATILPSELIVRSYYSNEANPLDSETSFWSSYEYPYTMTHTEWIQQDINFRLWMNITLGMVTKSIRFHNLEEGVNKLAGALKLKFSESFGRLDDEIIARALMGHIQDLEIMNGTAPFAFLKGDYLRSKLAAQKMWTEVTTTNVRQTMLALQSNFLSSFYFQITKRGTFNVIHWTSNLAIGLFILGPVWTVAKSVSRAVLPPGLQRNAIAYNLTYGLSAGLSTSILYNIIWVNTVTDYIKIEREEGFWAASSKAAEDFHIKSIVRGVEKFLMKMVSSETENDGD